MPILLLLLLLTASAHAATKYVDPSCANNGTGVGTTCATSAGQPGPWNSVRNALEVAECSGMSAGDTLEIRGAATQDRTCVASRSCSYEDNVNIEGNCHDITIQNYAGEHAILDGTVDIKGTAWTSIGNGVYQCSTNGCAGDSNDAFAWRAWYKRTGQSAEEELDVIQTSTACTTSLAAGTMTVVDGGTPDATWQRACVKLSDGSNPADAQYFRIPWADPILQAGVDGMDNITLRKNPMGGSFRIQRARKRGIEADALSNTGWVIDGLEWAYMMDRCVAYADDHGSGNIQIRNNIISFCGQEGIRLSGDLGTWVIENNIITDIQTEPVFQRCAGIAEGCRDEFTDNGTGIRLLNQNAGVSGTVRGNVLLRMGGGRNNRARMINFEHANNHIVVERNYLAHSSGLDNTGVAIMWSGSFDLDKNDNIIVRNNLIYDVDRCFWVQYGTNYDSQAGTNNYILNNHCVEFEQYGLLAEWSGSAVLDGAFHVINNVFRSNTALPTQILNVPTNNSTGWTTLQNNVFECDACTANQDIIDWRGVIYERDEDCTATTDCIDDMPALSGAGYTGNKYGDINVNTSGGTEPALTIAEPSEAADAGQTLALVTNDYTSADRLIPYDAGAYNIGTEEPSPPLGEEYDIAVARFALDASTGNREFRLTDFSQDCTLVSVKCAAIFVITKAVSDGAAAAGAMLSLGFTDGTSETTVLVHDNDASQTSVDSDRSFTTTNRVVEARDNTAVTGYADFAGWLSNGVQLNTVDAMPANYLMTVVLMGGTSFNANVGSFTSNGTLGLSTDINTVGFLPDGVLLSGNRVSGSSATTMLFTLGAAINDGADTQGSIGCYSENGVNPSNPHAITSTTYAASLTDNGGQDLSLQVGGFDAQGFTATTRMVQSAVKFAYLAFSFGGPAVSIVDMNTRQTIGTQGHSLGYTPLFAMVLGTLARAYDIDEDDSDASLCMVSFGTASADGQYANTTVVEDALMPTNTASFSDNQGVFMPFENGTCNAGSCFQGTMSFAPGALNIDYTSVYTDAARKWIGFTVQDLSLPARRGVGMLQ